MKYIKTFESYSVNEEFGGLGILALGGLVIASTGMYAAAKKAWSKHITGSKYKPTGKTELVKNEDSGKEFTIVEYVDSDGNLYFGYDHLYDPKQSTDFTMRDMDLYRSMYKVEDKSRFVSFLKGIKANVDENPKSKVAVIKGETGYIDSPEAVDIIFIADYDPNFMKQSPMPKYLSLRDRNL